MSNLLKFMRTQDLHLTLQSKEKGPEQTPKNHNTSSPDSGFSRFNSGNPYTVFWLPGSGIQK